MNKQIFNKVVANDYDLLFAGLELVHQLVPDWGVDELSRQFKEKINLYKAWKKSGEKQEPSVPTKVTTLKELNALLNSATSQGMKGTILIPIDPTDTTSIEFLSLLLGGDRPPKQG